MLVRKAKQRQLFSASPPLVWGKKKERGEILGCRDFLLGPSLAAVGTVQDRSCLPGNPAVSSKKENIKQQCFSYGKLLGLPRLTPIISSKHYALSRRSADYPAAGSKEPYSH